MYTICKQLYTVCALQVCCFTTCSLEYDFPYAKTAAPMLVLQELWTVSQGLFLFGRVISFEEGKKLAESWKAPFLEASAKENSVSVSSSSSSASSSPPPAPPAAAASSSSSSSSASSSSPLWTRNGEMRTHTLIKVPSFSELGACLPV